MGVISLNEMNRVVCEGPVLQVVNMETPLVESAELLRIGI